MAQKLILVAYNIIGYSKVC